MEGWDNLRIIACIPVYNEEELLKECLLNVEKYVDIILIIDGAYKNFDEDCTFSTDKTLDIITEFMVTSEIPVILLPAKEWQSSMDKFNNFFTMFPCKTGDWMFLIDADDRIVATETEWLEFKMTLQIVNEQYPLVQLGTINYVINNTHIPTKHLIKWNEAIRYGSNHSTWINKNGETVDIENKTVIYTDLVVERLEHLRGSDRQNLKAIYNERVRPFVETPE